MKFNFQWTNKSISDHISVTIILGQRSKLLLIRQHTLLWRHNGRGGVSNLQPHDCSLNRSSRSKKTSKTRVAGLYAGNSPVTGEFPAHKWPLTRKMFPFDDVIMKFSHGISSTCIVTKRWGTIMYLSNHDGWGTHMILLYLTHWS